MDHPVNVKHSKTHKESKEPQRGVLFLGLPMTPAIAAHLSSGHVPTIALFISEERGLYLEKRLHDGVFYLGKTLDNTCSFDTLKAAEQHLHSLLCRVLDTHDVALSSLVLFAL